VEGYGLIGSITELQLVGRTDCLHYHVCAIRGVQDWRVHGRGYQSMHIHLLCVLFQHTAAVAGRSLAYCA